MSIGDFIGVGEGGSMVLPLWLVKMAVVKTRPPWHFDEESARRLLCAQFRVRDLAGFDAVVHLAGEPVAGLWTAAKRDRIHSSRVDTTRALV